MFMARIGRSSATFHPCCSLSRLFSRKRLRRPRLSCTSTRTFHTIRHRTPCRFAPDRPSPRIRPRCWNKPHCPRFDPDMAGINSIFRTGRSNSRFPFRHILSSSVSGSCLCRRPRLAHIPTLTFRTRRRMILFHLHPS